MSDLTRRQFLELSAKIYELEEREFNTYYKKGNKIFYGLIRGEGTYYQDDIRIKPYNWNLSYPIANSYGIFSGTYTSNTVECGLC